MKDVKEKNEQTVHSPCGALFVGLIPGVRLDDEREKTRLSTVGRRRGLRALAESIRGL